MAVNVALAHSVLPDHAFQDGSVKSNSHVEVTKDDELVSIGDGIKDTV